METAFPFRSIFFAVTTCLAFTACEKDSHEPSRNGAGEGGDDLGGTASGGSAAGSGADGGVHSGGTHSGGAAASGGTATGGNGSGGVTTGGRATGGASSGGLSSEEAGGGGAATGGNGSGGLISDSAGAGGIEAGAGNAGGGTATDGGAGAGAPAAAGAGGQETRCTLDPGAPPDFSCDPGMQYPVTTQGRNADGSVAFVLYRCMSQACAGGCNVYDVHLSLCYDGRTDEAGSDQLEYTRTHHNIADSLIATLPDRQLQWRTELDPESVQLVYLHYVAVETLGGDVILAETQLRGQ